MTTMIRPIVWLLGLTFVAAGPAIAQRRGGAQGPPPTPQASAAIDLTGQWVAIISEDWRHRMMPPRKGDFESVPLNAEGRKVASGWDLAAERAAGEPCRAYGAPGVMRIPGRLRISWENATTLRLDLDAGIQTRRFFFGSAPTMAPSWQGTSAASWEHAGGAPPRGGGPPAGGSLKVVTTGIRPGLLRKNGIPYSANALVTEHYSVVTGLNDDRFLIITTIVEDPQYLTQPFITSTNFKKQRDTSGWNPTPCSVT